MAYFDFDAITSLLISNSILSKVIVGFFYPQTQCISYFAEESVNMSERIDKHKLRVKDNMNNKMITGSVEFEQSDSSK